MRTETKKETVCSSRRETTSRRAFKQLRKFCYRRLFCQNRGWRIVYAGVEREFLLSLSVRLFLCGSNCLCLQPSSPLIINYEQELLYRSRGQEGESERESVESHDLSVLQLLPVQYNAVDK